MSQQQDTQVTSTQPLIPQDNPLSDSTDTLIVDKRIAQIVGLNESIALRQLNYWLERRIAKEIDGRYWIYNTYKQWQSPENFPFWSISTIRRVFESLEGRGLVITTDQYNKENYDNTKWYTIDYDKVKSLLADHPTPPAKNDKGSAGIDRGSAQNEQGGLLKLNRGSAQIEQGGLLKLNKPIPQTTTKNTTQITTETTTTTEPTPHPSLLSLSSSQPIRENVLIEKPTPDTEDQDQYIACAILDVFAEQRARQVIRQYGYEAVYRVCCYRRNENEGTSKASPLGIGFVYAELRGKSNNIPANYTPPTDYGLWQYLDEKQRIESKVRQEIPETDEPQHKSLSVIPVDEVSQQPETHFQNRSHPAVTPKAVTPTRVKPMSPASVTVATMAVTKQSVTIPSPSSVANTKQPTSVIPKAVVVTKQPEQPVALVAPMSVPSVTPAVVTPQPMSAPRPSVTPAPVVATPQPAIRISGDKSLEEQVWDATLSQLKLQLGEHLFETYLHGARLREVQQGVYVVEVSYPVARDMLQHRYYRNVRTVLSAITNQTTELRFCVAGEAVHIDPPQPQPEVEPSTPPQPRPEPRTFLVQSNPEDPRMTPEQVIAEGQRFRDLVKKFKVTDDTTPRNGFGNSRVALDL